MSKIIAADIEINENIVTALLREQWNIPVEDVLLLGEGWDNAVYLVNKHLVFRFPRRAISTALIAKEMRVLPLLKNRLTLTIPEPIYLGKPAKIFNRPFYGHEMIKGKSGCAVSLSAKEYEQAAVDLGLFLKGLHGLNISELPLIEEDVMPCFDRTDFSKALPTFTERLRHVENFYDLTMFKDKFGEICVHAACYQQNTITTTLLHGDMYHRHVIFDDKNRLSGVIDWGDCAVGDSVGDLGIVYQFLPKSAHPFFFENYGPVDNTALQYARFIGLYLAVALLWFGHDRNDKDLIRTSLWTFREI